MIGDSGETSPFTAIIHGQQPGTIISRDDERRFALIESIEPEAAVHWLALPFESGLRTEELQRQDPHRFLELVEWAIAQAKLQSADYPDLENGFTVKFHLGAFETIPHAKLHILSVE